MTTTANGTGTKRPRKQGQETWEDWLGPDAYQGKVYSREEFIDELRRFGIKVDTDDFRFWEGASVLPRAVKKWRDGATRALYPAAAKLVVFELRQLQDLGYTLRQIAPRLRKYARFFSEYDPHDLEPRMIEAARAHERATGKRITAVQVAFLDEDDRRDTYHFDIPPDEIV